MENDEDLVSINTEKVSGKLARYIFSLLSCLTVYGAIAHINQLKGTYLPKVREIVELISCETSGAIPVMRVPEGH